jgi:hypothetical protein
MTDTVNVTIDEYMPILTYFNVDRLSHGTFYSYLMGVQAIDQNSFPEVLAKTNMFYCPRAIEHFGLSKYRGL